MREAVIGALLNRCEIPVPEASVAQRVDTMVGNFKARLRENGVEFADYLVDTKRSEETLRAQLRVIATEAIKKEVVLWHVAQVEGILVQPAEVDERVGEIAGVWGGDPGETRTALEREGRMPHLVQEILFDKVSDFLLLRCVYE